MHRVGYALIAGLVTAVSVPAAALASIVSLPVVRAGTGADVVVPVVVSPADGVTAIDFLFSFDPAVVRATGVYRTGFGNAFAIEADLDVPGEVDLALTSPAPLAGSGPVAWIVFRVLGGGGAATNLTWISARLNGGAIPATTQNGRLTVSNGPTRFDLRGTEVGPPGAQRAVPLLVQALSGADGIDLVVRFNQHVLSAVAVEQGPLAAPFNLTQNVSVPGQVSISLWGSAAPVSGSGELVRIVFAVLGTAGAATPLDLVSAVVNESSGGLVLDDGLFTACGAPDAVCNGIDEDCDGTPDDAYVPRATACGVGACAASGSTICRGGVEQAECVPGTPSEEVCDALDNDCNGTVDDPPPPPGRPDLGLRAVPGGTRLEWTVVPRSTAFDIVRGGVAALRAVGGFAAATDTCLADDLAGTGVTETAIPSAGSAFWYLVRPVNCGGAGTFDSGGPGQQGPRDPGIAASVGQCP